MDIAKQLAIQIPVLAASITLLIAAILKAGREKGAILVLLGAVALCLLAVAVPVVYSVVMPRVIETVGVDNIQNAYLALGLTFNILWATALVLIAIGTLLRPPAVSGHRPAAPYPDQPVPPYPSRQDAAPKA